MQKDFRMHEYVWNGSSMHFTENPISVFPEMKLCGLLPNSYIHVYVNNLYITRIGLPIWLQQKRQTDPAYINRSQLHECGIRRQNIIILFCK